MIRKGPRKLILNRATKPASCAQPKTKPMEFQKNKDLYNLGVRLLWTRMRKPPTSTAVKTALPVH